MFVWIVELVATFWQLVPFGAHALPARLSAILGDPEKATPASMLTLKCFPLRGTRFPRPTMTVGASLLKESFAEPFTGFARLLSYWTPFSVKKPQPVTAADASKC